MDPIGQPSVEMHRVCAIGFYMGRVDRCALILRSYWQLRQAVSYLTVQWDRS